MGDRRPAPRYLDADYAVVASLDAGGLARLAGDGVRAVVDHRPRVPGPVPPSIGGARAAALMLGIAWIDVPVVVSAITPAAMNATRAASRGTRVVAIAEPLSLACTMWALARAANGGCPDDLVAGAALAGFDIAALAPTMRGLSSWSG